MRPARQSLRRSWSLWLLYRIIDARLVDAMPCRLYSRLSAAACCAAGAAYWRPPSGVERTRRGAARSSASRRCTPCVSTLHRILTGLEVGAFETALRTWIEPQLEAPITLEPVAIDGKAVRGAKEQHLPGAYLLSAFASRRGAVLAQLAIGERANELTQALPLLRQMDLNNVVVTGDALFAQRALCTHIVEHGGQYLFEVKDNQPTLLQALRHSFRDDAPGSLV